MTLRKLGPNILTASRLVFTPLIAYAILHDAFWTAIAIFILFGITDAIDGPIARRLGAVSRAGAYLDPVADKFFVTAIYVCLAWVGQAPWWLVGIVLARDVLLLLGAAGILLFTSFRGFRPSAWGKAATTIHVVTIVTLMVRRATDWFWVKPIAVALVFGAAAITVWSGLHYARQAMRFRQAEARSR